MNKTTLAIGLWMLTIVGTAKLTYGGRYIGHGPTMPPDPWEPIVQTQTLKDGLPLPECNPCPWNHPRHGPTMPPDPGEPIR